MTDTSASFRMLGQYRIDRELGRGAISVVYKSWRGDRAYAMKIMATSSTQAGVELAQEFRREAAALARLDHPSLVKILEVGDADGKPYLVMELAEGENLGEVVRQAPLSDELVVAVAEAVAGALREVHRFGLVHRDIKPSNIMLDRKSGTVKLIDFGFATTTAAADAKAEAFAPTVGTLLYAAPEQIGVIKRPVDGRSDLYALGSTLFECYTGAPPFRAPSTTDFLHQLATSPVPEIRSLRPDAHPVMAAVVHKLLAKDPDDRYQSASSLLRDLEALPRLDEDRRAGRPLVLGSIERDAIVAHEVPLVGRQADLDALLSCWRRATQGHGCFVQVEGEAGSGKTRLVRELLSHARAQPALILMGKCQAFDAIPFGPLREAIDEHVNSILAREGDQGQGVALLRQAAGDSAYLLKRFSPGLKRVFEGAAEKRAWDPEGEQRRFIEALAEFLVNLGRLAGPLVLVVDDVQWLDDGSRQAVQFLAKCVADVRVLVATTSRNDPQSEAARAQFVADAGRAMQQRVTLGPLDEASVGKLITSHLGGVPLEAVAVTRLAFVTRGNPFAVGEYVRALIDSGHLQPSHGIWRIDIEALSEVHLPRDVVKIVVNRMSSLEGETPRLLTIGALLGGHFSPEHIRRAAGVRPEVVTQAVQQCLQASLIERTAVGAFAFVHDRVREAAIGRLSDEDLRKTHQQIALALDNPEELEVPERLLAVAQHYAQGRPEESIRRAYETNLDAGLYLLRQQVFVQSYEFLHRAAQWFGQCEELRAIELWEGLGHASTMTGRHEEALAALEKALRFTKDRDERFRLQMLLTQTCAGQGRNAFPQLWESFRIAGRPYPKSALLQTISMLWYWGLATLLRLTGFRFGSAKGEERARRQAMAQLYNTGSWIALFDYKPGLLLQFLIRNLYNTHFLGIADETAYAHGMFGQLLGMLNLRRLGSRRCRLAIEFARQLGNPGLAAFCGNMLANTYEWSGDPKSALEWRQRTLDDVTRHLSGSWELAMCLAGFMFNSLYLGRTRGLVDVVNKNLENVDRTNCANMVYTFRRFSWGLLNLTKRSQEALEIARGSDRIYDEHTEKPGYMAAMKLHGEIMILADQGEGVGSLALAEEKRRTAPFYDYYDTGLHIQVIRSLFDYYVSPQGQADRSKTRQYLNYFMRRMNLRCFHLPQFRCHLYVVRAALARVDGDLKRAGVLLTKAEAFANRAGSVWGIYEAQLELARLAKAKGDLSARGHAIVAFQVAADEGWRNKTHRVSKEFDITSDAAPRSEELGLSRSSWKSRSGTPDSRDRYANALLQVSLASASTLDADAQARAALQEVAKVLGAERALFFLVNDKGQTELRASYGIDGGDAQARNFSTTVVNRVRDTRQAVIVSGTEEGEVLGSESVVAYGLRSIIAAPLMLRDKLVGVVYLDNRLARGVFTEDDISILLGIGNHIAIAIETARAARAEVERNEMERDLALTGAVQSLLLPKQRVLKTQQLSIMGGYKPAAQCGGDWWWCDVWPDDSVGVFLGDVTGHGVASAMVTALVAGSYHALRSANEKAAQLDLLKGLHKSLKSVSGVFGMTISAVQLDPGHGELHYWNAGGPPIFIWRHAERRTEVLSVAGEPFGSSDKPSIGTLSRKLNPGDRLLMCTDGVLELRTRTGREIGARGVTRLMQDLSSLPIEEAGNKLQLVLEAELALGPQMDDITYVLAQACDKPSA